MLSTRPDALLTPAVARILGATADAGSARALGPGRAVRRPRVPATAGQRLPEHEGGRWQSRRGDCYAKAPAESWWSRLQTEVLDLREQPVLVDLAEAQGSVADYVAYYNHARLHSRSNYQTP